MKIVICGLSLTSSWGNGHATTYRGLVRELTLLGHEVLFLECDRPWYAENRDMPETPYGRLELYKSLPEFKDRFHDDIRTADAVIVGSFVPEGADLGEWIQREARGLKAFYDIDTPVTIASLERGEAEYLRPELIPHYDLYLSFTGGPILERIEREFGSPRARVLYCSVDTENYFPEERECRWDLGYLGTYSADRQPAIERLMLEPAHRLEERKFVVAGPQYPETIAWGRNVERIYHLPPNEHRAFYNNMRFTLNVTRRDMVAAGYSPSVRLFEAAACGTPIISDYWAGLESVFEIGSEILVARNGEETRRYLTELPEKKRREIGARARERALTCHSAARRAKELETYLLEARETL